MFGPLAQRYETPAPEMQHKPSVNSVNSRLSCWKKLTSARLADCHRQQVEKY